MTTPAPWFTFSLPFHVHRSPSQLALNQVFAHPRTQNCARLQAFSVLLLDGTLPKGGLGIRHWGPAQQKKKIPEGGRRMADDGWQMAHGKWKG
jgi:hypothetical protein